MKITICDDNINDMKETEKLLNKFKTLNPHTDFRIDAYMDSSLLFDNISKSDISDVYILDILMPQKSGFDIGKLIRKSDTNNFIIFTTSSKEYAMEAYGVKAGRYLLKPLKEKDFFEAVNYALSVIERKNEFSFLIKTQEGVVSVPSSKIEYIENISRTMHIYMTNRKVIKSLCIRSSFEKEADVLLCNKNFLQVHKSFIVNMDYIEKLSQENIILTSGLFIPVSKKNTREVKSKYLVYVTEKYK